MGRTTPFFAACLLLTAGCAPRHTDDQRFIDSLRIEGEAFLHARSTMEFNRWVAGAPFSRDSLYRLHAGLFTPPVIERVSRAWEEESDSLQRKRLDSFRRFLSFGCLARAVAPLADRMATLETEARVAVDGDTLLYRQLPDLIANEKAHVRREALYRSADPVLDSLNLIAKEIQQTCRRVAQELGYPSTLAMAEALNGFSLDSVRSLASRTLAESDSLYFALLPLRARETTGLEIAALQRYDLPVLFRKNRFDRFFPQAEALASVRRTYRSLGIDLSSQGNLSLDTTEGRATTPGAACFPLSVPGDVRLGVPPSGGVAGFESLYHEMGRAQQCAHITEHAFEFRCLEDPVAAETFASLSEHLLCNPAWLRQVSRMDVNQLKDLVLQMALKRLALLRRQCALFLSEYAFQQGAQSPDSLSAALLAQALGTGIHPSDRKRFLADTDGLLSSAVRLRAWLLEAQLNRWLSGRYGVNWYENPQAGTFLTSLWAPGGRITAEDLVSQTGAPGIAPDAWVAEIREMVRLAARENRR